MAERHAQALNRFRKMVEVRAQWARQRLGFVVVIQASQMAPTLIVAELDQARAELDAKEHPAQREDRHERRRESPRARVEISGVRAPLHRSKRSKSSTMRHCSPVPSGRIERARSARVC